MDDRAPRELFANEVEWEQWYRRFRHPVPQAYFRFVRRLPADPRCKICNTPFAGVGGRVFRRLGYGPSRKNPNLCNTCFEKAPLGGAEMDIGVLFADIRGFTRATEQRGAAFVTEAVNRFYAVAVSVLCKHAVIDKMIGDEVMALFVPAMMRDPHAPEHMVACARNLLSAVGYGSPSGSWVDVGVGLDWGNAFVGNIGTDEVKDFTAIGDVVNTAARVTGRAKPGQIVLTERAFEHVRDALPPVQRGIVRAKGKAEPVRVRVLSVA